MSHELLLISGPAGAGPRAERRRVLEHAAARVPGVASWQTFEDDRTAVALVHTSPGGGTAASFERTAASGLAAVLGASQEAVDEVVKGTAGPWSGAEHGHVQILVDPDGTIEISTDGTGIIASFWHADQGRMVFSTHLASLVSLGVPATLDEAGSLEYLVMLQPLGTRTVLAGTSLLTAGGTLRVGPGSAPRLSVQNLYVPSPDSMGDDEAVHEFSRLWSAITDDMVSRAGTERLALGLSGGLDSRAIAAEFVRRGSRPHAFTYGSSSSRPGQVAAEVASVLQLDHTLLAVSDERLMPDPKGMASLLDGAHSPAEMYELWFGGTLKSFADVVVNGKAGGTLWGDEKAMGIAGPAQLVTKLEQRFASELAAVRPFLEPALAASAGDLLRTSLEDSMREWESCARSDLASFWNVHNRQFRWGNMLSTALRRFGVRLEAPFTDARFLRFSARLTTEQRLNGRLYLRAHRELFPETAGLARSDDGNAPSRMNHVYWSAESSYANQFAHLARRHPVSAMRRASGRVQGNVASSLAGRPRLSHLGDQYASRHSVFVADAWLRGNATYRTRLHDFLSGSSTPSILSSDEVGRVAHQLSVGEVRSGALRLARVATLQAWHEDFAQRAAARPAR